MSISFAENASLTCPQCKTSFDAEIWRIVDAGERPDLAARCRDGSIHLVTCPNKHSGLIGAPLLYHDRAKQQLLLVYPQGMTEQQLKEVGPPLLQQLRGQILILPGGSYLDSPRAIPYALLPAAIDDKLDEAVAELQARAQKEEAIRQNPTASAALRVLEQNQTLAATIVQWINLDAWNTSKQFLETHPELLGVDAELVLAAMLDLARAQDDANAQQALNEHREIVRVARGNGIDAAYQKYLERGGANEPSSGARAELEARLAELGIHSQQELERALPDHPELQELVQRVMMQDNPLLQAINHLMNTRSPQEVVNLARGYPVLLSDEGMHAIREIIVNARAQGDVDSANHLQERFGTLEQIKAGGTESDQDAELSGELGDIPDDVRSILQEMVRLTRLSDMPRKIELLRAALERVARKENANLWAALQNDIGNAQSQNPQGSRAENLEAAIRHYEAALEVYTRAAYPEDWGMTQNNLATAFRNRIRGERAENLEAAIRHYEAALEVYTRAAYPADWAGTQNNLANAYSDRIRGERAENLEAAIRHFEAALLEYTADRMPARAFVTARNLGNLYFEQPNWAAAHRAFAIARQASENLLRGSVTGLGQQHEMRQLAELYDRDLAVCWQLYAAEKEIAREALEESEAARSRAFLRQLGLGEFAPPESIPAPLVTREREVLARLREIENNLANTDTRGDRMSEMERALTERRKQLREELERVWDEMRAASPDAAEYIGLRRGDTPRWDDLSALAARLGEDAALVEFHVLDDRTLAFVWRAGWDAPEMVSLPLTRERLLHRYLLPYAREVLSVYHRAQALASGREPYHDWLELGEELLAPLVERRSDGTSLLGDASPVYFIPHGYLHTLPLHALTVNGEPFITRRAVAYAPSAAVLKRVLTNRRARAAADKRNALVMGYTEYVWQREIFNGEAIEVAKLFGSASPVDEHATRAVLAERAPDAPLIHLSCHGAFDGGDPLNSGVALADGLFTARDWMRLNLRADLVTLSACQLAFSDLNPGDDLVGMTRALMYAGASSVLLALWSVRADTTLEWMLDFYKRIQSNGTPQAKAFAFRDATLALREKDADPYVWAPFVLVGDWQ